MALNGRWVGGWVRGWVGFRDLGDEALLKGDESSRRDEVPAAGTVEEPRLVERRDEGQAGYGSCCFVVSSRGWFGRRALCSQAPGAPADKTHRNSTEYRPKSAEKQMRGEGSQPGATLRQDRSQHARAAPGSSQRALGQVKSGTLISSPCKAQEPTFCCQLHSSHGGPLPGGGHHGCAALPRPAEQGPCVGRRLRR